MKIGSKMIAHLIKKSKSEHDIPKGSECFIVCLEKDSSDNQTAKVYFDLKKNSTLKQILPALVEDVIKQTQ